MEKTFNSESVEETKPKIVGHLLIRDLDTGEVLVNRRDTMAQPINFAESFDVEGESND